MIYYRWIFGEKQAVFDVKKKMLCQQAFSFSPRQALLL
ncbi:hypothetical protein CHCC20372_2314 [Bacillus paralicheniformis]|nr:hypothetical protein CHCC20372_2314 [Bacillus paralicheniformis]